MLCHWSYKYLFSRSKDVFSAFDDKNTNHLYSRAVFSSKLCILTGFGFIKFEEKRKKSTRMEGCLHVSNTKAF